MTPTRTPSDLFGTKAAPATVTHGAADATAVLDLTTGSPPPSDGSISVVVTMPAAGSNPTANCTLLFSYSYDGTDFIDDASGPIALDLTAASVSAYGPYPAPAAAKKIRATLHNGDATYDYYAWVAAGTVSYS